MFRHQRGYYKLNFNCWLNFLQFFVKLLLKYEVIIQLNEYLKH